VSRRAADVANERGAGEPAAEMTYVRTPSAPISSAPLSQAVRSGHLVFTAGVVGARPEDGVLEDDVRAQARQAFRNLAAILTAAGSGIERAVKVTIYLRDASDYSVVNEVYDEFFVAPYPARSTVQAPAPNPMVLVEIEMVGEVSGDLIAR
jgi:2-iminobutanoate/2-iminopropanoate deaminase